MKKKAIKTDWQADFDNACKDHDGIFGHNIEVYKKEFAKLIKLGATIKFTGYYDVVVQLPKNNKNRIKALIHITEMLPNENRYDKKKDKFFLEWHY